MTLKEKFKQWLDTNPWLKIREVQLEVIADDYAIEFLEWADDNYFRMGNTNVWSDSTDWESNKKVTTRQLSKIFKKEKGYNG